MVNNKGIFGFLKGISKSNAFSEEEQHQRNYAMAKEKQVDEDIDQEEESEDSSVTDDMVSFCKDKLDEILSLSELGGTTKYIKRNKKKLYVEIINSNDVGRLIGKDGGTLESLQTLLKGFVYKKYACPIHIVIDIENYRNRRRDALKSTALKAAKTVIQKQSNVNLKPMNGADRRIIHILFKNHDDVQSYSVGTGQERHVVLATRTEN
jgi:predicted RNA-binding protein Jag